MKNRNGTRLRQILTQRFSDDELRTLCFDLGLDYDLLPGEGKGGRARELLRYLDRRDRIDELIEVGQSLRPDVPWMGEADDLPKLAIPHNLPPRSEFVGREAEKARVYEALASRYPLVSIDGIGGIGKTSLALEVAYECLQASREAAAPDGMTAFAGFIWATAKGSDLALDDLLDAVARTLDYLGIAQRPVEEKRNAVERLLREQPYLLLVDNLETVTDESVRDFLLKLPEPSKAIITTREQILHQVWAVSLRGLTETEALTLFRSEIRRLGLQSLESHRDGLTHLYQATGGVPMAIKWAMGQIKQQGQSLDTVLTALHKARGDIFRAVFDRSWEMLTPDAQKVLLVMPLFATSASREALEAASDIHAFALDQALGKLVEMSLVEVADETEPVQRRYSVHSLTRSFAKSKLDEMSQIDEQSAFERLAEFFQSLVEDYKSSIWSQEGYDLLDLELSNILAVLQWCWNHEKNTLGFVILDHISDFLIMRGYWNDAMRLGQQATDIAKQIEEKEYAATFQIWPVSCVLRHRGDLEQAKALIVKAIEVLESLDSKSRLMWGKRNLGRVCQGQGDLDRAEELFRECLSFSEAKENLHSKCLITFNLATVLFSKGDIEGAWKLCNGIIDVARDHDFVEYLPWLLSVLGQVALYHSDTENALKYGTEALTQAKRIGRPDTIGYVSRWLAEIAIQKGQIETARQRLGEALECYRRLDVQPKIREIEIVLSDLESREYAT